MRRCAAGNGTRSQIGSSGNHHQGDQLVGALSQFSWTDYLLALPITLLTLFALGVLLIDLILEKKDKWANAVTAMIGVLFSAGGVYKIQLWLDQSGAGGSYGMMRTMLVDRFAIYFFYLFLAATAIAILMSVRYLEIEDENHGEYYALMLLSVAGIAIRN